VRRPSIELLIFKAANGRRPFVDWFDCLRDRVAQAAVAQRLAVCNQAIQATVDRWAVD